MTLHVSLFGPLQLRYEGREIRLRSRKARAVLGYLAISGTGEETRERLVGLLWSESDEDHARASLRQTLRELREALEAAGCPHLHPDRLSLVLPPETVQTDLADLLAAVEAGGVPDLLLDSPLLPETLLQGLDGLDPAFRVWLLTVRQGLQDRLARALEPRLADAARPPAGRQRVAQALLRLDPTHEEACRALMRSLAAAGDTAAALRSYESLWHVLDKEFDTEPTAATQKLVAEIKLGRLEPVALVAPPPVPAAALPSRIALLVEPFLLNGVGLEQQHLTQGFRHDLLACLVRFREWFVVDGPALPPPAQTAQRVSARYRISATAYRAGRGISMVLTLSEDESGICVWSDRIDLTLERWFETQTRIVRRMAVALNLQVSSARMARLAHEPDVSLPAFDRWLRSQAMIFGFRGDVWERNLALLHETVAESPHFAPAWSTLAQMDSGAHIMRPGVRRDRIKEARALENARRAAQLDATDARSQLSLGWALAMAGRHAQAEVHMRLATDLNPLDSWVLMSSALFHCFHGQHERAEELAEQSMEMTLLPTTLHWGYQVTLRYLRGDYLGTLDACDRAEDVIRTLPAWRAAALANLGRHAEAAISATRFLRTVRDHWFGAIPPTDEAIMGWLLHLYPIADARDWEKLRDGVAAAGLPTAGRQHGDW
jgi:DNA-binding SARP family transcriptional activator/TolB-like protein